MVRVVDVMRASGVPYEAALAWQRERAAALRERTREGEREALALIEHEPVYTMGLRGGRDSLRVTPEVLPAPLVDVERGGDVTWHGPGQLVGYPILDLRARDLRAADYVHALEALLVEVLAEFGIGGTAVRGRPGAWVGDAKVAAIGLAIRGGVTMHGFALNVASDLGWYDAIVPCGIADAPVTSMAALLGGGPGSEAPEVGAVTEAVQAAFERRFACALEPADPAALLGAALLGAVPA
jgi:lipoyl(octanoyl) transferase